MQRRNLLALAVAGVLAGGGLTACSDSPNAQNKSNAENGAASGFLSIGMPNSTQTENNNPFIGSSSATNLGYRWMIYEPLGQWNNTKPDQPLKPWLASEITWSADWKTVDLTIRDGATWSDGKPVTAEDVVFTHTMIRDSKDGALNIYAIPYDQITAEGNKVKMTFKSSQFTTHHKLIGQTPTVPKHIWSTIADPATDTIKTPVGSGPYKLKTWSQTGIILEARDSGYWQELPKVKELRYTSYSGNDTTLTALASGQAEWSFVFIPDYEQTFIAKDPANHKVTAPGVLGIHGLYINTTRKPFDDPKLRQAMNMVVNRADIFKQAEAGYFHPEIKSVTGLPDGAGDPYITDEYKGKTFSVDVEGAKTLLTGAGYKLEGDVLKDKTGKPVTIKLTAPAPWSDYQTSLEIIKDNFAKIGIAATVEKPNQNVWDTNVQKGDFDATMRWTNGGSTPFDIYQTAMDGDLYKPIGTTAQQGNFGRFQSPEATAALKAYSNATDDAARKTALATLQKIFVEQAPMLPVGADNVGAAYSTKKWVGWPTAEDSYAPGQPTQAGALMVVLNLKPAGS
ncbi:ABC transporter substrate-binding protein [Actinoplanes utahensis]|uniref:Peptide ABC transporter substrate-binding protein n=1 Tax=Actinoplanes utahensis TaxID=1869 RepID=A0A0A6X7V2_ACTUT|nr:ABC transporter substrate-binding protein [Actinoplanes utahensis]KHD76207.1 peptide ABC transporter substrate-binding protein [Actinoplanes utahensis]GIF28739.1 peptide ABC transporter substrate-binding protein [Actinoplanes utahensis]